MILAESNWHELRASGLCLNPVVLRGLICVIMNLPQVSWMVAGTPQSAAVLEESLHSIEYDAGEYPGRGNLTDRATETNRRNMACPCW